MTDQMDILMEGDQVDDLIILASGCVAVYPQHHHNHKVMITCILDD
jgi:hypothetical protein